jgi:8-oxo-dGTP pyrophosphatase MutT (NUDIX family)
VLDLDPTREAVAAQDAATLVVVRDAAGGGAEVFCVERQRVGFLGGAVVFPGGKLDPADLDVGWRAIASPPVHPAPPWARDEATVWGLAIAACREALEEAAILPLVGEPASHETLVDWQRRVARKEVTPSAARPQGADSNAPSAARPQGADSNAPSAARPQGADSHVLRDLVSTAGRRLDLASLVPLARWITPVAEARRYDTRFFLLVAGPSLTGAHDGHETTASFWAPPAEVLRRFDRGELMLAPPTHRTLEILSTAGSARDALVLARAGCLEPICPRLVAQGDTVALALPGDPEHEVATPRSPGPSRYVLRAGRFVPDDANRGR